MPRTTTVLLPDVNVLLAGFRTDHIHHRQARAFMEAARSQTETLAISDVALTSLVRLATNPRVFVQPDIVEAVLYYVTRCWTRPRRSSRPALATGLASRACVVSSTCGAISYRMPTWQLWRSSNGQNWSRSTAGSGATRA